MKVDKGLDNIYFSHGWYIDHTDGIFNIPCKELTIINDRFLPLIIKYLRKFFSQDDSTTINLYWYRNK